MNGSFEIERFDRCLVRAYGESVAVGTDGLWALTDYQKFFHRFFEMFEEYHGTKPWWISRPKLVGYLKALTIVPLAGGDAHVSAGDNLLMAERFFSPQFDTDAIKSVGLFMDRKIRCHLFLKTLR